MESRKSEILIGTSGWSYDDWVGTFYPKGITSKDFLYYYSNVFYTNEINTTFYNIPSRWVVNNWMKRTPKEFLFTAKVPQVITHKHKLDLERCSADLDYFLGVMDPLIASKKLLAFLIQLPPSFKKDEHFGALKDFVKNWPDDWKERGYYLAIEFRDLSWMKEDTFEYLRKNELTYCAVIEPLLPPRMDVTNPEFVYIRFHGFGKKVWFNYFFSEEEIKNYSMSIKEVIQKSKRVGIYFNNHFTGYATKNSLMMMKALNSKPRNEPNTIKIFEVKKKSGTLTKGQTSLDKFF